MSDIEFRFVQPNEFDDWRYEVHYKDGIHYLSIIYDDGQWCVSDLIEHGLITVTGLKKLETKIAELNSTTKPKNIFGF